MQEQQWPRLQQSFLMSYNQSAPNVTDFRVTDKH
jgi:hypothetical protein